MAEVHIQADTARLIDLSRLETVACNLCGSRDEHIFSTLSRFNLPMNSVICQRCGLMYLNPRMGAEQYREFYKVAYRQFVQNTRSIDQIFETEIKEGRDLLRFAGKNLTHVKNILEIGSGPAGILQAFREAGFETAGIEPSEAESAYARAKGLNVQSKMLEEMSEQSESFDGVILSKSLNHFADPAGTLRMIWDLLRPEGILILQVLDYPAQTRYGALSDCSQADHLYMFSPEATETLLQATGFDLLDRDVSATSWFHLRRAPVYHMKFVARKGPKRSLDQVTFSDYRAILRRIEHNQGFFRVRRLMFAPFYLHAAGSAVRFLLGERIYRKLKSCF